MIINSLEDLSTEIGSGPTEGSIAKALFKGTKCGISFAASYHGVSLCGYVEGSDAECVPHELVYPFTPELFWDAVQAADDDGCELWDEVLWQEAVEEGL